MSKVEERDKASIEITPPNRFSGWALIVFVTYGLLLLMPALLSIALVSTLRFGFLTYAIPLATLAAATLWLPFGFGNRYAARMAQPYKPAAGPAGEPFLVQVTFTPRLRSGLRSILEDADDIGWLICSDSTLLFCGDSVKLSVPLSHIRAVRRTSVGWRGLFLYPRIAVEFSGLEKVTTVFFAERSAWVLPASRRVARALYQSIKSAAKL